ncbi:MAG: GNAT family N-acetyltransferase [Bacillota bacterium]
MVIFKKMKMEDLEEHMKLQRKSFLPLLEKYQDGEFNPANITREEMRRRIEDPNGFYFKILANDLCVGGVYAYLSNEERKEMCMSTIYIAPDMQGQRFAQKALNHLESICGDIRLWWLEVPEKESKNRHLYEKFGYKQTGEKIIVNDRLTLLIYRK